MSGCPFRNFEECPEHNKKGGCIFWLNYSTNSQVTEARIEGCAITLTPILLMQQINNLAVVADEVNKVGAEVSAGRCENIKSSEATRRQLVSLANGYTDIIEANYTLEIEGAKNEK